MIIYFKNEEYSHNFNGELPKGTRVIEISCLSTDTKPTENLVQGSLALEVVKIYGRCSSASYNLYVMNFIIQEQ